MTDRPKAGMSLEEVIRFGARQKGLRTEDLSIGDVVTIRTKSRDFEFVVLDPRSYRVRILKGDPELLPDGTETYVNGSSITGSGALMRSGWMAVGFHLWLGFVFLPVTREILVNGETFQVPSDDDGPASAD